MDIYDQWDAMEKGHGKWRFTSPTHVVRAFKQAMDELAAEGGVEARHARYCRNHDVLVEGMRSLGFKTLLKDEVQSPIITSFLYPDKEFDFKEFYHQLKEKDLLSIRERFLKQILSASETSVMCSPKISAD